MTITHTDDGVLIETTPDKKLKRGEDYVLIILTWLIVIVGPFLPLDHSSRGSWIMISCEAVSVVASFRLWRKSPYFKFFAMSMLVIHLCIITMALIAGAIDRLTG